MNYLSIMLADGTRYHPRYKPSNNSDHMPMTLCAIVGLGGDESSCSSYQSAYRDILQEIPKVQPCKDWQASVGDIGQYPALFAWLTDEIRAQGIERVIRTYLPLYIESLAMDAFHPIIRLGYAIHFQSDAEAAAALAYLMACHRPTPTSVTSVLNLYAAFEAQTAARKTRDTQQRFSAMIQHLIDTDTYPTGRAETLQHCAALSLDIYRGTRNFFALHMVTATHAVRLVSRYIDKDFALCALTGALLAAHDIVGAPGFSREQPKPAPAELDREHTFKYAWTCLSEYQYYGDERYAEEIRLFRNAGLIPAWCAPEV